MTVWGALIGGRAGSAATGGGVFRSSALSAASARSSAALWRAIWAAPTRGAAALALSRVDRIAANEPSTTAIARTSEIRNACVRFMPITVGAGSSAPGQAHAKSSPRIRESAEAIRVIVATINT
jgi:hypothetical protein